MGAQQASTTGKRASLGKFLKSARAELKKVNWPNKQELKTHTTVVIFVCALATVALWILDSVFGLGLSLII
jgi:preprotein translocase subunit SecE